MENLLASVRIYLMVIVFFSSCFLGIMSGVSLPILAIRSIVIVSIVGLLSHLFIKYFVSVAKTVSSEEPGQAHNSVLQKIDHAIDQNTK
ncbi:MAG: hypothetical protein ACK41Q_02680 [Candidatus Brocadia sp.]